MRRRRPRLLPVLGLTKTNEQSAHLTKVSRCLALRCRSVTYNLQLVSYDFRLWSEALCLNPVVILMISSVGVSSGLLSGQDRVGGQTEDKCPHRQT